MGLTDGWRLLTLTINHVSDVYFEIFIPYLSSPLLFFLYFFFFSFLFPYHGKVCCRDSLNGVQNPFVGFSVVLY